MRNPFKSLAGKIVTIYANKTFKQAIKIAEGRHTVDKEQFYVITHPVKSKELIVVSKKEFKSMCKKFNLPSSDKFSQAMKNHCWYHTRNKKELDAITERDFTIRRLAFIRHLLSLAKLA